MHIDTPSVVGQKRPSQSANCVARGDGPPRFSMTLSEIAANLGTSLEDVVLLEQRAITKARVWARENGYRLEDLLGIENPQERPAG